MNSGFEKGVYSRAIIVYILHQIVFHSKIHRFSFQHFPSNIVYCIFILHFEKTLLGSLLYFLFMNRSVDDPKLQITKKLFGCFSFTVYLWMQKYLMTSEFVSVKMTKANWVEARRWPSCPFLLLQYSFQSSLARWERWLPPKLIQTAFSTDFSSIRELGTRLSHFSPPCAERGVMSLTRIICH